MLAGDENIARMHIGMEEAVTEYLGKEDFNAAFSQNFHIGVLSVQLVDIRHWNTVNTLAYHDLSAGVVPVHFWHIQQFGIGEVTT